MHTLPLRYTGQNTMDRYDFARKNGFLAWPCPHLEDKKLLLEPAPSGWQQVRLDPLEKASFPDTIYQKTLNGRRGLSVHGLIELAIGYPSWDPKVMVLALGTCMIWSPQNVPGKRYNFSPMLHRPVAGLGIGLLRLSDKLEIPAGTLIASVSVQSSRW